MVNRINTYMHDRDVIRLCIKKEESLDRIPEEKAESVKEKAPEKPVDNQRIHLLEISPAGRLLVARIGNNIFMRVIN